MRVDSAVELVNSVVYKPGWKITAEDHTNRFEGAIRVRIDYPALDSNREEAKEGYVTPIPTTYAVFPMVVIDCDDVGVYRHLLNQIIEIEVHEAREFLRIMPNFWAPFHPHRVDGMRRWHGEGGDWTKDLQFGLG